MARYEKCKCELPLSTASNNLTITVPVDFDGVFDVEHLVLPTKEWVESEASKKVGSILNTYSIVYCSDGKNIYKYVDGQFLQVPIEEILEVNPENTTLSKNNKNYVSICYLRKCYINLCLLIFNSRGFNKCWNKNDIDSELIFKRDLLWMALNVIKYLTDNNQLDEVERIIEQIRGCNGLCSSSNTTTTGFKSSDGCGCSK